MKNIKILITAGGTSEKIDNVRKITNTATGKLGSFIAEQFIKNSKCQITYLCGENTIIPQHDTSMEIIKITTTNNLKDKIIELLTINEFDAVIHTMAVSDYTVKGITTVDYLSSAISEIIYKNKQHLNDLKNLEDIIKSQILQNTKTIPVDKKISSDIDNLIMLMSKTTKIISLIKKLQPKTILVGFKLLIGVSDDVLLDVGYKLLAKNNCDFVFANNLDNISSNSHEGILIEPDYSYKYIYTKKAIAEEIVNKVLDKLISNPTLY